MLVASLGRILSNERITKVLIRPHGCTGWSAPLLFPNTDRRQVFSCRGHLQFEYLIKKTFCGFSMGRNQYWAGRVYDDVCLLYDGSTGRLTESHFMEKLGIKPATPGLQYIGLSPTPWRLHKVKYLII